MNSSSSTATPAGEGSRAASTLALIPRIDAADAAVLAKITQPVKRLYTDRDLAAFQQSEAHRIFSLFVTRLAEASVGRPTLEELPSECDADLADGARRVLQLLAELDSWTRQIEREQGPQRFGNIAFRTWGERLEQRARELHEKLLPPALHPYIVELLSPFLSSFGNFTRIDYGSGHELSFALWLCLLFRLNFFVTFSKASSEAHSADRHQDTERMIALLIFPAYLRTVYAIQDRYSLEPAGSHGVWGLDDFQFLPYIIGAAQLSAQETFKPRDVLHPPPGSNGRPAPFANLYSLSIARVLTLKHGGPFAEHSPMLTDIASSVPTWSKVLRGLLRMYDAEVLGKRVVVQLWDFGGVGWVWEGEFRSLSPSSREDDEIQSGPGDMKAGAAGQRQAQQPAMAPTTTPWASGSTSRLPAPSHFAPSGAPWASSSSSGSALGARLGVVRPAAGLMPPPSTLEAGPGRTSLYSTGSAAAATSPFGSLARSTAAAPVGRVGGIGTGTGRTSGSLRDPLAEPGDTSLSQASSHRIPRIPRNPNDG
ncbi:hypothetical protein V8E36_000805 [Tilletia maclaganii]